MNFLLDSHTLLWSILEPSKLSPKVAVIIEDSGNQVFVSAVSFWEISMKFSLGKLQLNNLTPHELPGHCAKIGYTILPLSADNSASYHQLNADWHRDPFDRMLIWQAITNKFTLLSKDKNVALYKSVGLKLIW